MSGLPYKKYSGKAMEGINFITGNYTLPLEGGTEIDRRFCLECHSPEGEGSSWDEIKVATNYEESNPHDSHHGEQECNICHNMHEKSYAFVRTAISLTG